MDGIVEINLSKSAEKLSSGYRINRAADDAAGFSMSEKMRRQIRGLSQASDNAQDGQSDCDKQHQKTIENCSLKLKFFCFHNRNFKVISF